MSMCIGALVNIWNLKCILGYGEHWTQEEVVVRAVKLVKFQHGYVLIEGQVLLDGNF